MTEQVKPLTAEQAEKAIFYASTHPAAPCGGDQPVADALQEITRRRRTVIDTPELERLRAEADTEQARGAAGSC